MRNKWPGLLENGNTVCKHEEFDMQPSRQFLEAAAYMLTLLGKKKNPPNPQWVLKIQRPTNRLHSLSFIYLFF